MEIAMLH
jgi:uncharacterized protein (UPF0335 family)